MFKWVAKGVAKRTTTHHLRCAQSASALKLMRVETNTHTLRQVTKVKHKHTTHTCTKENTPISLPPRPFSADNVEHTCRVFARVLYCPPVWTREICVFPAVSDSVNAQHGAKEAGRWITTLYIRYNICLCVACLCFSPLATMWLRGWGGERQGLRASECIYVHACVWSLMCVWVEWICLLFTNVEKCVRCVFWWQVVCACRRLRVVCESVSVTIYMRLKWNDSSLNIKTTGADPRCTVL